MKTKNILLKIGAVLLVSVAMMLAGAGVAKADEGTGTAAKPYCTKVRDTWSLESSSTTMGVCEHAGHGWMEFEYEPGFTGALDYAPEIGYMSTVTIPEVCVKYGGFMHYGYFQYKNASGTRGSSSASIGGLGHIGSPTLSGAGGTGTRALGPGWTSPNGKSSWDKIVGYNGAGTHTIYKNGQPAAHNVGPVAFSTGDPTNKGAWERYQDWRSTPEAASFTQTWSNGNDGSGGSGDINWFCWGKNMQGSGFTGKIEAQVNGHRVPDGYNENYPAGTEVTIDYTDSVMRSSDSVPVNPVNITFTGRDDKNAGSGYTANKGISSGQTVYQPATAKITVPATGSITICHYLVHPTTLSQDGTVSGSKELKHCITFGSIGTRTTDHSCGDIGISYGQYSGESDAQMIFSFNGTQYKLGRGGSGNTKSVWAVPGDSVKYTYKFCGSTEYPRYQDNDRPEETLKSFGRAPANEPSFVITAQSANHIFDLTKTTYKKGDLSDYFLTITTPKDSHYYCELTGGRAQSPNHFQIPAGTGCPSSSIASTDVGKTRYQQLQYSKIKASKRSERVPPYTHTTCWCASWTTTESGGSRCSDRTCTTYSVYHYDYWSEMDYNNTVTLKGEYKTPYNYQLVPYTKRFGHNDGVVYAGSTFNTASYVATIQRQNADTNKKYATHTKNTQIIVAYFTTDTNGITSLPGKSMQRLSGSFTKNTICNAFGVHVVTCDEKASLNSVLNKHTGQLNGATNEYSNISAGGSSVNGIMSINVPIVKPGLKMCVAVGVYPADSHDNVADSSVAAMSESGKYYSVGAPACVTIAKKPTFSVESGDFYTNGSIVTSTSTVGSRIFGSWAEYGLIAVGGVEGMGSGAAYGYKSTPYNNSNKNYAGERDGQYRIGIINTGASDGGISTGALSDCSYSQQTYGNEYCNYQLGYGTILMNSSSVNNVLDRIKKIYLRTPAQLNANYRDEFGVRDWNTDATTKLYHPETNNTITLNKTDISGTKFSPILEIAGTEAACKYSQSLGRYVADDTSRKVTTKDIDNNGNIKAGGRSYSAPSVYCTADGNKYYRSSDNAIMTSGFRNVLSQPVVGGAGTSDLDHEGNIVKDSYRNPVYIYDVKGTLVVDTNIITHNGGKGDDFESLDQIPVVILMADNIIISDRVNRIDAWIITPGNLNTCGVDTSGMSPISGVGSYQLPPRNIVDITGLKFINSTDLNSEKCKEELLINGTVFAGSVTLNRTYGGGATATNDTASFIKRGEIFNQRADAFYWSYYQAQRSRVMTTVYSRELPTRF